MIGPTLDPTNTERHQRQLETLDRLAQRFGTSLADAFSRGAAEGKQLDGVLDRIGRTLASAALKPVQASLKTGFESLFKDLFSGTGDGPHP